LTPVALHTIVEVAAYFVGVRLFLWQRRRLALSALADRDQSLWIGVAAIVGAALGAKLGYWIENPRNAFANFPDWRHLLEGKTIVGALLGGLIGVESVKRYLRVRESSGDAFALPLMVGIAIGRIGCFLAGLDDHTYGNPTALPWGADFGDGVPRHPTQLYEIAFLLLLAFVLHPTRSVHPSTGSGRMEWTAHSTAQTGDTFRKFMIAYLAFRLAIDFIKPMPQVYFGVFSGIQLLCLAGLLYYRRDIVRLAGELSWGRR
jgi:phosphatidylglycerol:prolipoprotein diacylglycerol transferase